MPKIRTSGYSKHKQFRRREISSYDELYYNSYYETPYSSGRALKPNRRMNGRPTGVCGSCQNRRGKRGRR